jgi:biopolymer transport protein ExbB
VDVLEQALGMVGTFSSIGEFFDLGGPVLLWIFAAALFMWTLIVERAWYFWRTYPHTRAALKREWDGRADRRSWYARRVRDLLVSQAQVEMSAGLQLMGVIIPLCPLLGLLGTVTGMMEVFDAMSLRGKVNPQELADGISHAMIATMAGLGVALSGMAFVHYFRQRVRHEMEHLTDVLEPGASGAAAMAVPA